MQTNSQPGLLCTFTADCDCELPLVNAIILGKIQGVTDGSFKSEQGNLSLLNPS
jgi:hypothetical protein